MWFLLRPVHFYRPHKIFKISCNHFKTTCGWWEVNFVGVLKFKLKEAVYNWYHSAASSTWIYPDSWFECMKCSMERLLKSNSPVVQTYSICVLCVNSFGAATGWYVAISLDAFFTVKGGTSRTIVTIYGDNLVINLWCEVSHLFGLLGKGGTPSIDQLKVLTYDKQTVVKREGTTFYWR